MKRARALFFFAGVFSLTACGPIEYTAAAIDADVELEAARTAGADKAAVYEFTSAEAYLHKAREEAGYADYEPARDYARKAHEMALIAKSKAIGSPTKPAEAP